jgi:type VI protein secretion system component VasF
VGLALVPLTAASGRQHQPSHSPSTATVCADVKKEQQSSSSVGLSIERAIQSGNFTAAKREMLNAYTTDLNNVQRAYGVTKQAPANVQAAFRDLLGFVQQIKTAIQNANSEQQLVASFEYVGKDPTLATDGTTIQNWFASKCGGSAGTTTTSSVP